MHETACCQYQKVREKRQFFSAAPNDATVGAAMTKS